MKKKLTALLTGAVLMMAASAWATPITYADNTRPTSLTDSGTALQGIINGKFSKQQNTLVQAVNVNTDQSRVAAWTLAEGDTTSYLVSMTGTGAYKLGIYSYADSSKSADFSFGLYTKSSSFQIITNSEFGLTEALVYNGETVINNFGSTFGFYLKDSSGNKYYTQDNLNAANTARSLSYLINDVYYDKNAGLTKYDTQFTGNNDWIFAFDATGDGDFTDAVFVIEDMNPVPEPGTIVLLGAGMLCLAIYGKRRMNKDA